MKYNIKQFVHTARQINGWFDYSLQESIPMNTPCQIMGIIPDIDGEAAYAVRFLGKHKEFGNFHLKHSDLKLM